MGIDITLEGIGHGALSEKFDDALVEVIKNTTDPNTDATTKRKLVIELVFTPNKNDRGLCKLDTKVTTKLGPVKPLESQVTMGFDSDTGEVAAVEHVAAQQSMFGAGSGSVGKKPEPEVQQEAGRKVVNMRG
jgi:hypothetical protein